MTRLAIRLLKIALIVAVSVAVTIVGVRTFQSMRGPPLEAWHRYVPDEATAGEIDAMDWKRYLEREGELFRSVRENVVMNSPGGAPAGPFRDWADYVSEQVKKLDLIPLPEADPTLEVEVPPLSNRYYAQSAVNPARFAVDWNRSQILLPDGPVKGAAVFLHGLTDTPFSMRHVAQHYRSKGFLAVIIRMPGHGTVPAGLTDADWEQWMAATRLAVREAVSRAGSQVPLHLVGYSNGGALAAKYALDALDDPALARPARLVLFSPMIGISAFARFAGVAGWPSVFPAFVKASWLGIVPEYNPFKYNSFPVQAAVQSHQLTRALQADIEKAQREGRLAELPPILTFQSIVDFTVSTRAVIEALYARLPSNGSELVLFDINRATRLGPLIDLNAHAKLERLVPPPPRNYRTSLIVDPVGDRNMVEIRTDAGATTDTLRPIGLAYPVDMFSLSHIALPFPPGDGLYGFAPDPADKFGVNLGGIAPRGETGILLLGLDAVLRATSNPFFPYMLERIDAELPK